MRAQSSLMRSTGLIEQLTEELGVATVRPRYQDEPVPAGTSPANGLFHFCFSS
ncbi:Uncharacterised protein [Paucimonas lemoignei]|nr:Uncharacterised protein [Paucimonas lemoignei]